MDMIQLSDYVKMIAVGSIAVALVIGLGGCGNTVKGIGTDIVKIGEKWSEDKPEINLDKAPVEKKADVPMYEPKKKGKDL